MLQSKNNITIKVSAPARLHLGFLDLHGGLGRLFGSLGIGLNEIYTELDVRSSTEPEYIGESALRAQEYAERMLAHLNIRSSVRLQVHKAIPEHAGLGSGTQMALAVGTAISKLFDAGLSLSDIARILDRGNRSGIGIGAFEKGGFIVDAGRSATTEVPPVVSQLYFPDSWRFVLVLDKKRKGVHGQEEKKAFGTLAKMDESLSADLCRLLVMQILPAIAEQDCELFGSAVTTIQTSMGEYFKSIQSGIYTSAEVGEVLTRLQEMGASGVGQSSWGPTGFAIYASETDAYHALKETRSNWPSDSNLELMICKAHNEPASIITKKNNYDNPEALLEQG